MNYKSDFLTKNIITYLGNKRKLLEFINNEVNNIISSDVDLSNKLKKDIKIFDIFSGSGIVSRCFKQSGYTVYSNDLEVYTQAINDTFINTNEEDLEDIFKEIPSKLRNFYNMNNIIFTDSLTEDNYLNTVNILNSVRDLGVVQTKPYFAIHYAPKDTSNPDFDNERLFYTQENGKFLDSVLDVVFNENIFSTKKSRHIILSDLFVKMTTNINTSGTMKGFHNGWGGVGGNAKERICADMQLTRLNLLKNCPRGHNFYNYAEKVFGEDLVNENGYTFNKDKVDIIYADPPYNQHQYSANYHMLTTAYNNRDYITGDVGKGTRAGIRVDHNRSDFSRGRVDDKNILNKKVSGAYVAFDLFIKNVMNNTKYIIISYNQEGVLSHSDLIDILSQDGTNSVSIKTRKHEKYKGGKNTNISNFVIEYLFIVKTNVEQSQLEIQNKKDSVVLDTYKKLLVDKYINTEKAELNDECNIVLQENGNHIIYFDKENESENYLVINSDYKVIEDNVVPSDDLFSLIKSIEYADFDKEVLLNKYIKEGKYISAIKMLKSFKIKKYQHNLIEYIKILNEFNLDDKAIIELDKIKKDLNI